MSRTKSNKKITFERDNSKSYVYIKDGNKDIGMLYWHYQKKRWMFDSCQKKNKEV